MTTDTTPITIADVQRAAGELSAARDALNAETTALRNEFNALQTRAMPRLRAGARKVAQLQRELADMIKAAPELFAKPRTYIVAGLKVGMQKAPPTFEWDDDAALCVRIRLAVARKQIAPELEELLIVKSEKPVASAIKNLPPEQLVAIGVEFSEGADAPVIKSVDDGVEKAVNAMIKDAVKNLDQVD